MKGKYDVLIVGGGITGAATAYFLAKRGITDVLLVEKQQLGSGSTGLCAGGVREQFGTEVNISMAKYSIDFFEKFQELTGVNPEFKQRGYLFMHPEGREKEVEKLVEFQRQHGVNPQIFGKERALEEIPEMNPEGIGSVVFNRRDGYIDPHSLVLGFVKAAKKMGVEVVEGEEVVGFETEGKKIKSVKLASGVEIRVSEVVNAAGPWAGIVAEMVGEKLPADPVRRHLFMTAPFPKIKRDLPMMVDLTSGLYFRKEGDNVLMGLANKNEPPGFNLEVDRSYLPRVILPAALRRVPIFREAKIQTGWAGLYFTTPDHHPIFGRCENAENMVLAAGFSGHGLMVSPATGEMVSSIIAGAPSEVCDPAILTPKRFEEGKYIEEVMVI